MDPYVERPRSMAFLGTDIACNDTRIEAGKGPLTEWSGRAPLAPE